MAEYTVSSQEVRNAADLAQIENSAWETQFSYVLTGENASYRGWPVPANPVNPWDGHWGAWEIAARYGVLEVDDAAFPLFADPAVSVREETNFGLAIHAYLNDNARFSLDYQNTRFDGGAADGVNRETEQVVLARLNYKF
jgi:phosphate-selective porin OprO/OprP